MNPTYTVNIDLQRLQALRRQAPGAAERAVRALALEGERYAKTNMGRSPSSPGDFPGVDTGALRASIHVENRGEGQQAVVCGVEYGVYLEFGTSRMAPRPFFAPTVVELEKIAPDLFDSFLER